MPLFFAVLFALAYAYALYIAPALPDRFLFAAPFVGLLSLLFFLAHVGRKTEGGRL